MTNTQIIAKEGYKGALILLVFAVIFWIWDWDFFTFLFILGLLIWLFAFRNPERESQDRLNSVLLAPIDGSIADIFIEGDNTCLDINVGWLDVGVLRVPIEVEAYKINKRNGLFLRNVSERLKDSLNTQINFFSTKKYAFEMKLYPQIFSSADIYQKLSLSLGERIGFMKLGRLKLLFPCASLDLKVNIGDKIKSGETLLGYIK